MNERQTNHRIFTELIAMLEDRKVVHIETGEPLAAFNDAISKALRAAGWTEQEIEDDIAYRAAWTAEHPEWTVEKDLPPALYYKLTRYDAATRQRVFLNETDEAVIFDGQIVPIPNLILNICICEALLRQFTREEVLGCPGFVMRESAVRLDVDAELARRGFMMPVFENDLIRYLRVFRYGEDTHPFILKGRTLEVAHYA